jgi:hypothetical protein
MGTSDRISGEVDGGMTDRRRDDRPMKGGDEKREKTPARRKSIDGCLTIND